MLTKLADPKFVFLPSEMLGLSIFVIVYTLTNHYHATIMVTYSLGLIYNSNRY